MGKIDIVKNDCLVLRIQFVCDLEIFVHTIRNYNKYMNFFNFIFAIKNFSF